MEQVEQVRMGIGAAVVLLAALLVLVGAGVWAAVVTAAVGGVVLVLDHRSRRAACLADNDPAGGA